MAAFALVEAATPTSVTKLPGSKSSLTRHMQRSPVRKASRSPTAAAHPNIPSMVESKGSSTSSLQALENLKRNGPGNRYTSEKSSIVGIGLTIHNAPVEVREKLAVPESEWATAIEDLVKLPHIEEAGILSTCNRMEIYVVAVSWHRGAKEVKEWMSRSSGIPVKDLLPYLFLLRDRDCITHLMRVSSGLESLVLGEGQILAQVKQVYQTGQSIPGFGRNLNGLFKQAIIAGKRVRHETSIAKGSVSVSSAAVELVGMHVQDFGDGVSCIGDLHIAIIGAGKMGTLLVKHAISKGARRITILNRSMPRAEALVADFADSGCAFEIKLMPDLLQVVNEADVVFTSTSSDQLVLHTDNYCEVAQHDKASGRTRLRMLVDIAVPRDIQQDIDTFPNSRVYNVDDLKEVVAANKEERQSKVAEAEILLEEELQAFEAWRDSLETVPTIKRLRAKAETIRATELDKTFSRLNDLSKKEKKAVEELSKSIVNKLLHGPMAALRSDASDVESIGQTLENMYALERMFSLHQIAEEETLQKIKQRAQVASAPKSQS